MLLISNATGMHMRSIAGILAPMITDVCDAHFRDVLPLHWSEWAGRTACCLPQVSGAAHLKCRGPTSLDKSIDLRPVTMSTNSGTCSPACN